MNALFVGLGNFLASLFGKSMSFFVHRYSGAIVFKGAQLGLMLAMFVALYAATTSILGTLFVSLPTLLAVPMSWVAPSNINFLITSYIAFRIALALYRWKHTQISKLSYA